MHVSVVLSYGVASHSTAQHRVLKLGGVSRTRSEQARQVLPRTTFVHIYMRCDEFFRKAVQYTTGCTCRWSLQALAAKKADVVKQG